MTKAGRTFSPPCEQATQASLSQLARDNFIFKSYDTNFDAHQKPSHRAIQTLLNEDIMDEIISFR